jgi:hypothetical protein
MCKEAPVPLSPDLKGVILSLARESKSSIREAPGEVNCFLFCGIVEVVATAGGADPPALIW